MWNALCEGREVPDNMDTQVQTLLDAIHQHHICRLGPADYVQVQQLLVVRPDFNRAELRVALASLLATNQEQWQQIAGLFEQYYPEAAPSDLSLTRSDPPPGPRRARAVQSTVDHERGTTGGPWTKHGPGTKHHGLLRLP